MGTDVLAKLHAEESRGLDPRAFGSPGVRVPNSDPWNATVTGCFRDIVLRYPHATAISDASGSMTYAQLWNFAGAFRARLVAQGIGNGDKVGVAATRSIATVAALIGIVLAGGCYVPVDVEGLPASILGQLAESIDFRCWIADRDARQSAHPSLWGARPVLSLEDISCPVGGSSGIDSRSSPRFRQPAVHHVHVRLNRGAQRSCRSASRRGAPGHRSELYPVWAAAHVSAALSADLRRFHPRALGSSVARRAAGGGAYPIAWEWTNMQMSSPSNM